MSPPTLPELIQEEPVRKHHIADVIIAIIILDLLDRGKLPDIVYQ